MNRLEKTIPSYFIWFLTFFKEVVGKGNGPKLLLFAVLGVLKDFANIAAFFIPLKVVMVLSKPDILSSGIFASVEIGIEDFILYSGLAFVVLVLVSLVCHVILTMFVHHSARQSWIKNRMIFPNRGLHQRLYQQMVDTITHSLIIIIGLIGVFLLDKYLSLPIVIVIVNCILASVWLSRYTKKELRMSPLKRPKLVFKLLTDFGFSLTFVFIIVEYYNNEDMQVLFTLFAVLLSKILFSNIQQLFVKQRLLFVRNYMKVRNELSCNV